MDKPIVTSAPHQLLAKMPTAILRLPPGPRGRAAVGWMRRSGFVTVSAADLDAELARRLEPESTNPNPKD